MFCSTCITGGVMQRNAGPQTTWALSGIKANLWEVQTVNETLRSSGVTFLEFYLDICLVCALIQQTFCSSFCCYSVAQSGLTSCNAMDCSTPGFPVLHHLLELAQTHVHWVDDAIQPSVGQILDQAIGDSEMKYGFLPWIHLSSGSKEDVRKIMK